jgi:hypothetical protein
MKEGYAQIPQGTVGTNTGFAILWLEQEHSGHVILDDHDAVTLEVADNLSEVRSAMSWLQEAFNRIIRLPRGLEFTIPIEFEIGYDLGHMVTVKWQGNLNETGLAAIYNGLAKPAKAPKPIINGQPLQSSPQPANATCG